MMVMKVITIWQPWATLIMAGAKPYEFRGWPAPRALVGTRIGVHAGGRPVKPAELQDLVLRLRGDHAWTTGLKPEARKLLERWLAEPDQLPRSCVLGTALLGEPRRAHEIAGDLGGPFNDSDRDEHSNWAWPMSAPLHFEPPIPAAGRQGFWTLQGV